jgi:hypothetical protein
MADFKVFGASSTACAEAMSASDFDQATSAIAILFDL